MNPAALLEGLGVLPTGAADDSRQLRPGELFIAYPGDLADGRRHIAEAIAQGAAAVLWEPGGDFSWDPRWHLPNRAVPGLRALAGPLAHHLFGSPSQALSLIAVTGTNGKTTVSQWVTAAHPKSAAVIGTLGAGFPGALDDTGLTTPEATTLMRLLADFQHRGAQACALEASSIGIEEGRLNGARVDVAVFTNFTRDHLDYHGTLEAYAAAKEKLFRWPGLRLAIVNLEDPLGRHLFEHNGARHCLGYALSGSAGSSSTTFGPGRIPDIRAEALRQTATGQSFDLVTPAGRAPVETEVPGRYNLANLLAAAAVLHDAGLPVAETAERLGALKAPPGRMEQIGGKNAPLVVVDYAHTPDALENALQALRPLAAARHGRLIALFGCGGGRDPGKRPLMGEIAARSADLVILTSDNPRHEDPESIIAAIRAGAPGAQVIGDRAEAILRTVTAAAAQDVILIAGKGHESYQEICGKRSPFSDVRHARAALQTRSPIGEAA